MVIRECVQGDATWHRLRNLNFTASELGAFALEPVKITLTVEEIKAELNARKILFTGITKRDDLLTKLPGKEAYAKLSGGAQTAIIGQIKSERVQEFNDRTKIANDSGEQLPVTQEEDIFMLREEEMAAKEEKSFAYNIPVKYGKMMEPFARECYEKLTGFQVTEVGFIEHSDGSSGFGCSPDGLVATSEDPSTNFFKWRHGIEIKCPIPETHIGWLIDGTLPSEHKIQVETCLAVTGLDRWDFLSYCPGYAPLLVTVRRSEFTEQLLAGLKILVAEKENMKRILAAKWEAAYSKPELIES